MSVRKITKLFGIFGRDWNQSGLELKEMMKKIIVALMALSASLSVAAQGNNVEASLSVGGPAGMLGMTGGATSYVSGLAEVRYTPEKWLSLAVLGGIHDVHPGSSEPTYSPEESKPGSESGIVCNLMLMGYINWYTGQKFKVYSGVGYGTMAGYVRSVAAGWTKPSHGLQFVPVGVSFGSRVFGFAELGMGWAYFPARVGVGYRF